MDGRGGGGHRGGRWPYIGDAAAHGRALGVVAAHVEYVTPLRRRGGPPNGLRPDHLPVQVRLASMNPAGGGGSTAPIRGCLEGSGRRALYLPRIFPHQRGRCQLSPYERGRAAGNPGVFSGAALPAPTRRPLPGPPPCRSRHRERLSALPWCREA